MLCLLVTLLSNLMGRLFLGDSGTYGLGILIGLLSIFIYNTTSGRLPADVVTIWFSVPVIDCLRLMADRAICKQRSPFSPDQNHLHHRMQLLLPKWLALVTYWMLVAVPGSLAIAEPKLAPLLFVFVFSLYLGIVVLSSQYWIARFTYFRDLLSRTLARRQARAFPGQGRSQARKLAPRSFPPPRPLSPRSEVKRNQTTSR